MKKLVLDIGGTNTRIGRAENNELKTVETIKTESVKNFETLLENHVKDEDEIRVAVAGRVKERKATVTNRDIQIKRDASPLPIEIYNDFESQARYVRKDHDDFIIVGPGTGLGVVTYKENILESEGGHTEIQFRDENLRDHVKQHVEEPIQYEDVASGPGLSILNHYVNGEDVAPKDVAKNHDKEVFRLFSKLLGRFIKNMVLTTLPQNVFITGGVAMKNPELINLEALRRELTKTKTHTDYLQNVQVEIIQDEHIGLKGLLL